MKLKYYALGLLVVLLMYVFFRYGVEDFTLNLINLSGIWIILALSLGLVLGYIGEISLCHAAFFGIGAYSSALLTINGFSFWVALPVGSFVTAVAGYLTGKISLRISGPYFAILTLSLGELFRVLMINSNKDLMGGADGITNIPSMGSISFPFGFEFDFGTRIGSFFLIYFFVALCLLVLYRILNSRIGYAIFSLRDDEEYAMYIGIDTKKYKQMIFVLSTFLCGIAGCLFAHYVNFISPYSFTVSQSFDLVLIVLIGGSGTLVGPVLGAFVLTFLPEFLHAIDQYRMLIYGFLLMVIIIFFPGGLYGTLRPYLKKTLIRFSPSRH
jgi:branched-chain amino acid transport system permease protein